MTFLRKTKIIIFAAIVLLLTCAANAGETHPNTLWRVIAGNNSVYIVFTHGDMVPANILDTKNGIKIIDWESTSYRSVLFDLLRGKIEIGTIFLYRGH